MPSTLRAIVAVLAVWRLTHLLVHEEGPGNVFGGLRRRVAERPLGGALQCFYCLSLWIAAPVAVLLAEAWGDRVLLWLGLSGGAVLAQRATTREPDLPPPARWEEQPLPAGAADPAHEH